MLCNCLCNTIKQLKRSRAQLTDSENELEYLKEVLIALNTKSATEDNAIEVAQGWMAAIRLRSSMQAEVGQTVIDCICMDEAVLRALGVAQQLQNLTCKAPPGLILFLKGGPGAHLQNHAYECVARYSFLCRVR